MTEKNEQIKYLISKKFPVNYIPREKKLVRQAQIKQEMWPEIEENIKAYSHELSQKTHEEVIELYKAEAKREKEDFERQQQEYEKRRLERLFFNQPNAKADFDYWCKMPLWTIDEATALLLGKDPRVVCWKNIYFYAMPQSPHTKPELFGKEYQNLRNLLSRQYENNEYIKIVPSELIEWASSIGLTVPETLKKKIEEIKKHVITDYKILYEEKCLEVEQLKKELQHSQDKRKELVTKTRATTNSNRIPKMALAVIAKDKYKYNEKSSAIGSMLLYFDKQGLNMDDKTLRGHIDEGLLLVKNKKPI